ncbi:MAG TPA: hypothetical protein V6C86_19590 [Oculatellaceae cyanobacterium]
MAITFTMPSAVNAAAVSFTPQPQLNGGFVVGRVPLQTVGNITLPRGRAYFKANMLEITAVPEWQFDRQQVLSGPILKCWSSIDGKNASINGIAYFQDGEFLKYIDDNTPDKVVTNDHVYSGQITAMKNGLLEVTSDSGMAQQVSIAQVQQIVSPRAYSFSVPVTAFLSVPQGEPISGESTSVSLKPTSKMIALAAVKHDPIMKGDGDISGKKLATVWAGLSTVEVLQFLPLVILQGPVRRELLRQYHSRMNQQDNFVNIQSQLGLRYQDSTLAPGANPLQPF